ncbi:MAG TPA: hypothetical protein VMZ91_09715 [Candidatus Paceibacterota bacterium]|nr:hypothetical protein [Candidatus Paceibacterota bacterium]
MNVFKQEQIKGILNYSGGCENFLEQYKIVNDTKLYYSERLDLTYRFGWVLKLEEDGIFIPIELRSYLNSKFYIEYHSKGIQTIHSWINVLSNRHAFNVIVAFIKDVEGDYFESYILLGDNNMRFSCICLPISDILNIRNTMAFPVFINKEVLEKRKVDYDDFIKRLSLKVS